MVNKSSFVFYGSYYEVLQELDSDVRLRFYDSIAEYALFGKEPELTGIEKALWIQIKFGIDEAKERYAKNVENGKKGGRPVNNDNPNKPSDNPTKPTNNPEKPINNPNKPSDNLNDNDNVNDNVNVNTLCECAPQNIGTLQKELFEIVTEHNKTADNTRKIPISTSFFTFTTKESRELLDCIGTKEPPDRIKQALLNYIAVVKSDTWRKVFSWSSFCKNYTEFTPEYFSLDKYLIKARAVKSDELVITGDIEF